jgi:hypothetical protein
MLERRFRYWTKQRIVNIDYHRTNRKHGGTMTEAPEPLSLRLMIPLTSSKEGELHKLHK